MSALLYGPLSYLFLESVVTLISSVIEADNYANNPTVFFSLGINFRVHSFHSETLPHREYQR